VAGVNGVTVGHFAWLDASLIDPNNAPTVVQSFATPGALNVAGFVHREQQGLITNWLGGASMQVMGGFPVTLMNEGGFFVRNNGVTYCQLGQKAFARTSDGAVLFGAAGSSQGAVTGATGAIAAGPAVALTGGIQGNVLTATAVATGPVVPGTTIAGTGIPAGTQIISQLSGTPGGVGTYAVTPVADLHVAPGTAITGTYGILTVTVAPTTGAFGVGTVLTGTGVAAGTVITALGTGTGGLGTYYVNNNTVVASTALTGGGAVETKWYATSAGAPGEIVKMSSWPLG
jgi:hypothetical protein